MLDFIIPTSASNLRLIPDCLRNIEENTSVPMSIKVLIDGGTDRQVDTVRAAMSGLDTSIEWRLMHEVKPVGQIDLINRALKTPRHPHTILIGPQVRIDDKKWVSKLVQITQKDAAYGLIDTISGTNSSTAPPVRRDRKAKPQEFDFAIIKTSLARKCNLNRSGENAVLQWFKMSQDTGHSCWNCTAIRFNIVDHEEHELCHQSGSQSQTTLP